MSSTTAAPAPILETRPVGPFAMNTWLVGCPSSGEAALIDAGGAIEWVQERLAKHGLTLRYLLQTHAHIDHVAALAEARRAFPDAPILLHPADLPLYQSAPTQGRMFGFAIETLPPVDGHLEDGQVIELGTLRFEVMFTPGHAPGHVAFVEKAHGFALSGDLLFQGSIGRTDLPGCNPRDMIASLQRFTKTLPPEMRVLCGHGPATTIGRELAHNPFLRPGALG